MSLEDWNGMERFLQGLGSEDEWLHFTMQSKPEAVEAHQEALNELESYRDAYMLAYSLDSYDLVNPSTKYSAEGLKD